MSDPFAFTDDDGSFASKADMLVDLNPEQRAAVEATEGPVLVLSGAGTGKTRVLTTRLAHIIESRLAQPWNCLVVTFTNKAAREMKERVAAMIGPVAESVWLGTFHSIALRILRDLGDRVGLKSGFAILDADDQIRLVKQTLEAQGIDNKTLSPQAVSNDIQRWKDRGLAPSDITPATPEEAKVLAIYTLYQERLRALNAVDFGDLLLYCLMIFKDPRHQDALERYRDKFRYILVDEYQDTNIAQYLWLRLLAQKHKNICCVGDDDQSIYSWRGAEIDNILRFEKDFPGARTIRLERNYRSTPLILAAASAVIAHNEQRLGKTLRPRDEAGSGISRDEGDKILLRGVWDDGEEAKIVADDIVALHKQGMPFKEMAILVRAGFQTRAFEDRLMMVGIPYRVIGGQRFYERQEIRDAVAYLRLIYSPEDGLAFERIVNVPKRGLGVASLQSIHVVARMQGISLLHAAAQLLETDELRPKARATLAAFVADIERWRLMSQGMDLSDLLATILEESGYMAMLKDDKSPEAPGRRENLFELVNTVKEYDTLEAFLDHISLVLDKDGGFDADQVNIMSLHAAKGLEFNAVFLPGWEEGLFPHQRSLDEKGGQGLEEERRLAYVGLTRARKRLFISFAANRRIYNQWQSTLPSRFIEELPEDSLQRSTKRGLYGAQPSTTAAWASNHRGDAVVAALEKKASQKFCVGERVFHQKFGYGRIRAIDGNKLEIDFEMAGEKKVMESFVSRS